MADPLKKKRVFTPEHRAKLSAAKKGKPSWSKGKSFSPEHKEALSRSHMGQTPWNKGNGEYAKELGFGLWMNGKKDTEETRRKKAIALTGRPVSLETREKIANSQKGEKSHHWKGGTTVILYGLRRSSDYKSLRRRVLERDGHKCVQCSASERLQIDHIKQFAYYPELRFVDENVRTLCFPCHLETETYGKFQPKLLTYV